MYRGLTELSNNTINVSVASNLERMGILELVGPHEVIKSLILDLESIGSK